MCLEVLTGIQKGISREEGFLMSLIRKQRLGRTSTGSNAENGSVPSSDRASGGRASFSSTKNRFFDVFFFSFLCFKNFCCSSPRTSQSSSRSMWTAQRASANGRYTVGSTVAAANSSSMDAGPIMGRAKQRQTMHVGDHALREVEERRAIMKAEAAARLISRLHLFRYIFFDKKILSRLSLNSKSLNSKPLPLPPSQRDSTGSVPSVLRRTASASVSGATRAHGSPGLARRTGPAPMAADRATPPSVRNVSTAPVGVSAFDEDISSSLPAAPPPPRSAARPSPSVRPTVKTLGLQEDCDSPILSESSKGRAFPSLASRKGPSSLPATTSPRPLSSSPASSPRISTSPSPMPRKPAPSIPPAKRMPSGAPPSLPPAVAAPRPPVRPPSPRPLVPVPNEELLDEDDGFEVPEQGTVIEDEFEVPEVESVVEFVDEFEVPEVQADMDEEYE